MERFGSLLFDMDDKWIKIRYLQHLHVQQEPTEAQVHVHVHIVIMSAYYHHCSFPPCLAWMTLQQEQKKARLCIRVRTIIMAAFCSCAPLAPQAGPLLLQAGPGGEGADGAGGASTPLVTSKINIFHYHPSKNLNHFP